MSLLARPIILAPVYMRAAYYETNGAAADVLHVGDVSTPEPGPGEVRVKLQTSGVNPSDVKSRGRAGRHPAFPRVIPHSDGAGEIDSVGPGVAASRVGERVWIWNGQWRRPFGTAAEYICLPQEQAVVLPQNVSFEAGAALGVPAMTAWYALACADVAPGATVFIPGGAGAVGFYAIQMAKMQSAHVITSVSSSEKAALASKAGADHTIDYKREDVAERIAEITERRGVDVILEVDLHTGAKLYPAILRPLGRIVIYGIGAPESTIPAFFCLFNNITLRFIVVYDMPSAMRPRAVTDISEMLAEHRLIHNIGFALPLDDIVAAHQAVERGAVGKVVVTIV